MKNRYKNVWTVVEEFGRKFNVRQWVLHYDGKMDLEWIKVWHSISKRSENFGYFSSYTISNHNISKGIIESNTITLHLYVAENLKELDEELKVEHNHIVNNLERVEMNDNIASSFWIIQFPENIDLSKITQLFQTISIQYDSMIFGLLIRNDELIDIYEIYKLDENEKILLNKYGIWRKSKGLNVVNQNTWSRRANLQGHHFGVAAIPVSPFITQIDDN